jgi:hypothetical protein
MTSTISAAAEYPGRGENLLRTVGVGGLLMTLFEFTFSLNPDIDDARLSGSPSVELFLFEYLTLIVFYVSMFLLVGYLTQVIRGVSMGDTQEPPHFSNWWRLFKDGLGVAVASVLLFVSIFLVYGATGLVFSVLLKLLMGPTYSAITDSDLVFRLLISLPVFVFPGIFVMFARYDQAVLRRILLRSVWGFASALWFVHVLLFIRKFYADILPLLIRRTYLSGWFTAIVVLALHINDATFAVVSFTERPFFAIAKGFFDFYLVIMISYIFADALRDRTRGPFRRRSVREGRQARLDEFDPSRDEQLSP